MHAVDYSLVTPEYESSTIIRPLDRPLEQAITSRIVHFIIIFNSFKTHSNQPTSAIRNSKGLGFKAARRGPADAVMHL